ncbi:hypothetical protein RB200_34335 [Streptomyces sp. PmtG]
MTAYGFQETTTSTTRIDRRLLPVVEWLGGMPTGAGLDIADVTRKAPELSEADAHALLLPLERARLIRRVI